MSTHAVTTLTREIARYITSPNICHSTSSLIKHCNTFSNSPFQGSTPATYPPPQCQECQEETQEATSSTWPKTAPKVRSSPSPSPSIHPTNTTKVPDDSARPNYIPSKARPDQIDRETAGGLGSSKLYMAADNATATTGYGEVASAGGGYIPDDIGHKYTGSGGKDRGEGPAPHGGRNQPSHGSGC
jgi:hypothetical protein